MAEMNTRRLCVDEGVRCPGGRERGEPASDRGDSDVDDQRAPVVSLPPTMRPDVPPGGPKLSGCGRVITPSPISGAVRGER